METCPYCKKEIRKELIKDVFERLKGHFFEHECSFCGALLEVEAVPVPEFEIKLLEPPNNACTPTDGGLSASDSLSTPATIGG